MGDPPETSLHEPSVHLPLSLCLACRLNPPFRPSTGLRGRQGTAEQPKVKPVVRQSTHYSPPPLGAWYCIALCLPAACSHYPTAYCTVQHRSETPLPLHTQSLILASAARRTPITSSPPLSLQITHHLPSHIFETSAVVISQVRYCPVATCPVELQPLHPEERRRRPGLGRLHEHCRCPVRGMASNC